eukprot:522738-Hanusia_phi.AAC.1
MRDVWGRTALIAAASHLPPPLTSINTSVSCLQRRLICIRVLNRLGGDVEEQDEEGSTALHAASSDGFQEAVALLQELGCDINKKNKEGNTSLMLAAGAGHGTVVSLLLGAGADVKLRNGSSCTAVMLAAGGGQDDCLRRLIYYKSKVEIARGPVKSLYEVEKVEAGGMIGVRLQSSSFTAERTRAVWTKHFSDRKHVTRREMERFLRYSDPKSLRRLKGDEDSFSFEVLCHTRLSFSPP